MFEAGDLVDALEGARRAGHPHPFVTMVPVGPRIPFLRMPIVVKYAAYETYSQPGGAAVEGPFLPVRLQHGGTYFDTPGLVDSGADGSLFSDSAP
jgi:hypothetical protein